MWTDFYREPLPSNLEGTLKQYCMILNCTSFTQSLNKFSFLFAQAFSIFVDLKIFFVPWMSLLAYEEHNCGGVFIPTVVLDSYLSFRRSYFHFVKTEHINVLSECHPSKRDALCLHHFIYALSVFAHAWAQSMEQCPWIP